MLQDPVNFVDPEGLLPWRPIAVAVCLAYEAYNYIETARDMKDITNKLDKNRKKHRECEDEDYDMKNELDIEYNKLQQEYAQKSTSIYTGIGVAAACAGIGKM